LHQPLRRKLASRNNKRSTLATRIERKKTAATERLIREALFLGLICRWLNDLAV
jgi:hypothetical protein